MQSEAEIAWAAGFFDGEGSLSILILNWRKTQRGFNVRVAAQCSQVIKEPLDKLCDLFGGNVLGPYRNKSSHKSHYRWHLTGPKLAAFLTAIEPYSIVKAEPIRLAKTAISLKRPLGACGGRRKADTQCGFENVPFYEQPVRDEFRRLKAELQRLNSIT